jgi:hypothetical protein
MGKRKASENEGQEKNKNGINLFWLSTINCTARSPRALVHRNSLCGVLVQGLASNCYNLCHIEITSTWKRMGQVMATFELATRNCKLSFICWALWKGKSLFSWQSAPSSVYLGVVAPQPLSSYSPIPFTTNVTTDVQSHLSLRQLYIYEYWNTYFGSHRRRRGSAAAYFLGLRVRIPPGAWMSVSCKCYVLSGRGLCDGPITRPEKSYRVWCVWVWSRYLDNG